MLLYVDINIYYYFSKLIKAAYEPLPNDPMLFTYYRFGRHHYSSAPGYTLDHAHLVLYFRFEI